MRNLLKIFIKIIGWSLNRSVSITDFLGELSGFKDKKHKPIFPVKIVLLKFIFIIVNDGNNFII